MYRLDSHVVLSRCAEMRRTAARERLAAAAAANQPGLADRAALAAGVLLVGAGHRLEHWAHAHQRRQATAPARMRGAH